MRHIGTDWDRWLAELESSDDSDALTDDDREYLASVLDRTLEQTGKTLSLETYGEVRSDLRNALESVQAEADADRDNAEHRIVRAAEAIPA
ncbi:MAG: hypothetical protein PGN29_16555 [Gordonia paraffinivorans]